MEILDVIISGIPADESAEEFDNIHLSEDGFEMQIISMSCPRLERIQGELAIFELSIRGDGFDRLRAACPHWAVTMILGQGQMAGGFYGPEADQGSVWVSGVLPKGYIKDWSKTRH